MKIGKILGTVAIMAITLLGAACGNNQQQAAEMDALDSRIAALESQVDGLQIANAELKANHNRLEAVTTAQTTEQGEIRKDVRAMGNMVATEHERAKKIIASVCEVDDGRDLNRAWIDFLAWRVDILEEDPTATPPAADSSSYQGICVQNDAGNFVGIKPEVWETLHAE